jgi:hypothetical protein
MMTADGRRVARGRHISADLTLSKEFDGIGERRFYTLKRARAPARQRPILYSGVNRDAGDSEAKAELTEL